MNTKIEITDEMVERAYFAYYTHVMPNGGKSDRGALRLVLEAALNPPPVLCKNCGKDESHHTLGTLWGAELHVCPRSVWEPAS